jgi:hypothetical protein
MGEWRMCRGMGGRVEIIELNDFEVGFMRWE